MFWTGRSTQSESLPTRWRFCTTKYSLKGSAPEASGMTTSASALVPDAPRVTARGAPVTTWGLIQPRVHLLNALWSPHFPSIMSSSPTPPSGPTVSS